MPKIEIRPALPADIADLIRLDHSYDTQHVWQMDVNHERDSGEIQVTFRQVSLPRSVRYEIPRPPHSLADDWQHFSGLLVAAIADKPVGYIGMIIDQVTGGIWIPDLLVDRPLRRQGIGSALILSAAEWASTRDSHEIILEIQPRNGPAVDLALKLGFDFCGFNDSYYPKNEIGMFFRKSY